MRKDRRHFLGRSIALGAASSITPWLSGCSSVVTQERAKVVVIGAGLAGLNAARILQSEGWEPIVLEASTRAGGRTLSIESDKGEHINMGGVEIGDGYSRFVGLSDEFSLSLVDPIKTTVAKGLTIYRNQQLVSAQDWPTSPVNPLQGDLQSITPGRLQSSLHLKNFSLTSTEDWLKPEFADLDIAESQYLLNSGASAEAIELINRAGNFNHIDRVSALHIARAIANYKFGTSSKTLRLAGGNDQLGIKMADSLADVRYGHAVQRIESLADGYHIDCQNGAQLTAEHIVIAIPFSVLRMIDLKVELPAAQKRAIATLPYTRISKMVARVEKPFWEQDGLPANMWCDSALERCFLSANKDGSFLYSIFINGVGTDAVDRLSPSLAQQWMLEELQRTRPSTKNVLTPQAFHSWGNDPFARGAYAAFAPGQISDFAISMTQRTNNLVFAGEHCSRSTSGMEGALESAENAVELLINA